ncbi:MAG: L-histidine N(alpha)-methyltransferase [Cyanobacterium sp. T60_A2020_053]|nr:L-histidine N(alpha)-methyltransferase [Cyanobacterium sp. T60_A2020_053]
MALANQQKPVEIRRLAHNSLMVDEGKEIREGLSNTIKSLPPKYFYDHLGSQLFEQICQLPEYYPTRTETAILSNVATEIASLTGVCQLVELGSGSSTKTRLLLNAYEKLSNPWQYVPIDVSGTMLEKTAFQLQKDYSYLSIIGLVGTYEQALKQLPYHSLPHRLIIFLGSSLGNFTPQECDSFFHQLDMILQEGDYFLLGVDLVKSVDTLEKAYNDSQGITAKFNLNMLSHLNDRFLGNFDLDLWHHEAIFNQQKSQIEMYLKCQKPHRVNFKKLDFEVIFTANDFILTEISRKFQLENITKNLELFNLKTVKYWTDTNNWFGLILFRK